jgi:hypothetical protein
MKLKNKGKNLGLKMGSRKEIIWTKIKQEAKMLMEQSEENLIIQFFILKLAELNIKEEREKFK